MPVTGAVQMDLLVSRPVHVKNTFLSSDRAGDLPLPGCLPSNQNGFCCWPVVSKARVRVSSPVALNFTWRSPFPGGERQTIFRVQSRARRVERQSCPRSSNSLLDGRVWDIELGNMRYWTNHRGAGYIRHCKICKMPLRQCLL